MEVMRGSKQRNVDLENEFQVIFHTFNFFCAASLLRSEGFKACMLGVLLE